MSDDENGLKDVTEFRRRLARAVKDLPRSEREQLLEQINTHLEEATSAVSSAGEIQAVLEALGSPEAIAASARRSGAQGPAAHPHWNVHPRHLTWVALGMVAAVVTLLLTSFGVLGLGLEAAFLAAALAAALVATVTSRPHEAAALYLIGACGLLFAIFLVQTVVDPLLPGLALGGQAFIWEQVLIYPVPYLIGLLLALRWVRRIQKTRLE